MSALRRVALVGLALLELALLVAGVLADGALSLSVRALFGLHRSSLARWVLR
jgi:hypothetical protein